MEKTIIKRTRTHKPCAIPGFTTEQVELIRQQPDAKKMFDVIRATTWFMDKKIPISLSKLSRKTGHKRMRCKIILGQLNELLY